MGKIPTSPKMLYEQMNDDLKKNGFEPTVADRASYQSTVTEIRGKLNQQDRVEAKLLLDDFIKDIEKLNTKLTTLRARATSLASYNELVTEKNAIAQINLGNFLGAGAKILDSNIGDAKCPFCLSDYDLAKLRVEVEARLQAIALDVRSDANLRDT